VERVEYERLAAVERQGWWFRSLHDRLIAAWRRAAETAPAEPRLLDAGCGTGGLLARLAAALPQARRFGLDIDPFAAALARASGRAPVSVGSVAALPFARDSFDAVFSADLLCHRGVEPQAALAAIRSCLKPGGVLILNLPAYPWLFSDHDRAVDNVRRFARGEVRALLHQCGYGRIRVRHWNSLLFPVMVLKRLARIGGASDVVLLPAPVEAAFRTIARAESRLASCGLHFPFGGSILATAVRP
jgi:SAM-dependent methyltransferase